MVHGLDGGFVVAAAHGIKDAVFGFVPLFQHGDGDILLELRLVEIPDVRVEAEGQKLLQLLHDQILPHHHPDQDPDGHVKIVRLQQLDAVVVFLHGILPGLAQVAAGPLAGLLAAGAKGPWPDEEDGVLLIRDAEEGKMQLKGALNEEQRLRRGLFQQQPAELLPVELGVQRSPQAVVKLFQPLKGRGDPPGRDILHRCQLCKDLQRIHPHRTPLLFPVVPLVPLYHS